MNRLKSKQQLTNRRAARVRSQIKGTPERPRLSVKVSNMHITAQLIDDTSGRTLAYATTVGTNQTGSMLERATWTGLELVKKAKKAKITKAVFDRGAKRYHGRVKALADAARKQGLEL